MRGGQRVQPSRLLQLTVRVTGMAVPKAWDHKPGGQGVQPSRWSQLMVRMLGMAAPNGAGSQAGGTGSQSNRRSLLTVRLRGMATPNDAGPMAGRTGSRAEPVVAADGAPVGDGLPQSRRLTGWGDAESSPAGRCSSWCACGEWQPPMARAHGPWGQGVHPSRWSQLTVCFWGMAAPNGAGLQVGGTGSLAQAVVAAHGAPVGDDSPQWRGLTSWGDGESIPTSCCSSRCAYGGRQPPMAMARKLGGRGVQPIRWSQLTVHVRGMVALNAAGPKAAWGTGCLGQPVVAAHGAPLGDNKPPMAQARRLGGRGV